MVQNSNKPNRINICILLPDELPCGIVIRHMHKYIFLNKCFDYFIVVIEIPIITPTDLSITQITFGYFDCFLNNHAEYGLLYFVRVYCYNIT